MGRDQGDAGDVGTRLDGDVPEGGGGINGHACLLGGSLEPGVLEQVGDQLDGLVPFNGAAGVGEDLLLLKGQVAVLIGHHVAAVGHIAGVQLNAGGGGLQGGAAGVADLGVRAEDGEDGGVAASGKIAGAVDDIAHLAFGGQGVYGGDVGGLEGGLPVQAGDRIVCHTVANNQNIFHCRASPFRGTLGARDTIYFPGRSCWDE